MKPTDKQFWISWGALLVLIVGRCLSEGWREDTALLDGAYALSLLSTNPQTSIVSSNKNEE